jgi:hypothetical protein
VPQASPSYPASDSGQIVVPVCNLHKDKLETPETGREIQDDVRGRCGHGEGGKLLVAAVERHVVEGQKSSP